MADFAVVHGEALGPYVLGSRHTDQHGIYTGDALELTQVLPDESVDCIYSDPPYAREYLYLYEWLANEGGRLIKPEGFALVMLGGAHKPEIFRYFADAGWTYYWEYRFQLTGSATGKVHPGGTRNPVIVRQKSIMAWSKGRADSRTVTYDWIPADGADKRFHAWGQDVQSARYYIDSFTYESDIVFDPFMGGGTTAVACHLINRRWLGFERDKQSATRARARLTVEDLPLLAGLPKRQRSFLVG